MNTPSFEDLERAFDEVAVLDPPSRAAFLVELRRETPQLADRLEEMLGADVSQVDSRLREATSSPDVDAGWGEVSEKAFAKIGRYRILGVIGEGGFGVVHLAEQPAPAHRLVALKVIKPGMDTRAVLARFGDESQALALMDHPGVVAALDAGTTAEGRPFIVMPLVAGLAITAFAREQKTDLRGKIALMVEVCRGVQHAHSRGVLHRDLKPGNILVARVDGSTQVKIIDFGLAKALASPLSPHSTVTLDGQLVGTPEYMSPEQALERQVDSRSDVYSLGAILYELLAGRAPFTPEELRSEGRQSLRGVLENRVPAAPSRFAGELPRELDWICLRCLEKDPALRYPTAESLAEDLMRFLDGKSVLAGPPAKLYRALSWLKRHKLLTIAVSSIALSMVAATGISLYAAARERAARENTEQVVEFLRSMFTGLDPVVAQSRDRELLVWILDEARERYSKQAVSPEIEAQIAATLAESYYTIGDFTKAYPFVMRSLELNRSLYGPTDPRSVEAFRLMFEARDRGVTKEVGGWQVPVCHELDELVRAAYPPGSREWIVGRMTALRNWPNNYLETSRRFRDLIAKSERSLGPNDRVTLQVMRRAAKHADLREEWPWGLDVLMEARRRAVDTYGADDPDAEAGIATESMFIARVRGDKAAIAFLRERLPRAEKVLGPLSQPVFTAKYNLAAALGAAGKYAEAEPLLLEAHELAVRKHGESTGWANRVDASLLTLYLRTERMAEAEVVEKRLWEARELGQTLDAELWTGIVLGFEERGKTEKVKGYLEHLWMHEPEMAGKVEDALRNKRGVKK